MTGIDIGYVKSLSPERAIEYLNAKGYAITWSWKELDAAAHAKAFTVAKATSIDVLSTIRDMVTKALEDGTTLQQFQDKLEPELIDKGWWGKQVTKDGEVVQLGSLSRLKTIYRTNMQSSYMAGRRGELIDNVEDRPYWEYLAVIDNVTRPSHAAMNGTILRFDDPFWSTYFPPNGYNCRCSVRALTVEEALRKGVASGLIASALAKDVAEAGFLNVPDSLGAEEMAAASQKAKELGVPGYILEGLRNLTNVGSSILSDSLMAAIAAAIKAGTLKKAGNMIDTLDYKDLSAIMAALGLSAIFGDPIVDQLLAKTATPVFSLEESTKRLIAEAANLELDDILIDLATLREKEWATFMEDLMRKEGEEIKLLKPGGKPPANTELPEHEAANEAWDKYYEQVSNYDTTDWSDTIQKTLNKIDKLIKSGDIKVNKLKGDNEVEIETEAGDVTIDIKTGKVIEVKAKRGGKDIVKEALIKERIKGLKSESRRAEDEYQARRNIEELTRKQEEWEVEDARRQKELLAKDEEYQKALKEYEDAVRKANDEWAKYKQQEAERIAREGEKKRTLGEELKYKRKQQEAFDTINREAHKSEAKIDILKNKRRIKTDEDRLAEVKRKEKLDERQRIRDMKDTEHEKKVALKREEENRKKVIDKLIKEAAAKEEAKRRRSEAAKKAAATRKLNKEIKDIQDQITKAEKDLKKLQRELNKRLKDAPNEVTKAEVKEAGDALIAKRKDNITTLKAQLKVIKEKGVVK